MQEDREPKLPVTQISAGAREPFIGVWRLIAHRHVSAGGEVKFPYGDSPIGRLTYDRAGRMSAQLMRPGRRCSLPPGVPFTVGNASDEELREAASGFTAYYGTYDIEEASRKVIHHVQACLIPSWVGSDVTRNFRFEANRLILGAGLSGATFELIWEREPD
ncbi:MAG TPA: lipocalin-like domain-containing protein [Bryobacteraceae bacterium]|nr:lipocalin-like domain-containing protein [Bryobacteraceae bacterium]